MKKTKKISKKMLSLLLVLVTILCTMSSSFVLVSAANYSDDYGSFDQPEAKDYAYWNGKKVVATANRNEIKWMQAALNKCINYDGLNATKLDVDGSFGPASKKATLAFQKATKLSQDGKFGPDTIKKMKQVLNDGKATFKTNTRYTVTLKDGTVFNNYLVSTNGKAVTVPTLNSKRISVAYNANGGQGAPDSTYATITHVGWATSANATSVKYKCGSSFTPSSNITLYPVWSTIKLSSTKPTNGDKTFAGWSTNKSATSASYSAGSSVRLSANTTLYAVWSTFKQQNILQSKADSSSEYISGDWYSYKGTGKYDDTISSSGCGIVALVSAVYNLGGTIAKDKVGTAIKEVFDWAYGDYWTDYAHWTLFTAADDKFGDKDKYNFSVDKQHGSKGSVNTDLTDLVDHLKENKGTAVVHVNNHFMAAVGYKVENGVEKIHIFDPGASTGSRRGSYTTKDGTWVELSVLKEGSRKNYLDHQEYLYKKSQENIEIDGYWLVSKRK